MLRFDLNFLYTIINILILYLLMRKFFFKPIARIINTRQEMIEQQFAEAEAAKKEAMEMKESYTETMDSLRKEKTMLLREARKDASSEYDRILGDARNKAAGILSDARSAAETEKSKIIDGAKVEIAEMIVTATARISAANADPMVDMALYDEFLKKAGEDSDKKGN